MDHNVRQFCTKYSKIKYYNEYWIIKLNLHNLHHNANLPDQKEMPFYLARQSVTKWQLMMWTLIRLHQRFVSRATERPRDNKIKNITIIVDRYLLKFNKQRKYKIYVFLRAKHYAFDIKNIWLSILWGQQRQR